LDEQQTPVYNIGGGEMFDANQMKELYYYNSYLISSSLNHVSLHPAGPATGQVSQGFPWFSSVLEQMLSWYPEFHVVLHVSHAALPLVMSKFRPNVALPMLVQMSP
jgi:hypothetical protein